MISRDLDLAKLSSLPDEAVIRALTSIKGIGMWTAKMYLIFVLTDLIYYRSRTVHFYSLTAGCIIHRNAVRRMLKNDAGYGVPYSSYAARFLYKALDNGLTKKS